MQSLETTRAQLEHARKEQAHQWSVRSEQVASAMTVTILHPHLPVAPGPYFFLEVCRPAPTGDRGCEPVGLDIPVDMIGSQGNGQSRRLPIHDPGWPPAMSN